MVPYSTKFYSFILAYEIWSNSLISECQKWCSGTQYLGKKDETDSIEPSYKEGLHMSAYINMSITIIGINLVVYLHDIYLWIALLVSIFVEYHFHPIPQYN